MTPAAADGATPSRRIDKWLWCARRFRTRSLAARFVEERGARVTRNGQAAGRQTERIERASYLLEIGDTVSYLIGERLVALEVTGFADRRGSPQAARAIYRDVVLPASLAQGEDSGNKAPERLPEG